MTENPLVSIITPVLNLVKNKRVESFKNCLESVHQQTYEMCIRDRVFIEVQSGPYLGEDDIVRLEDYYGRQDGAHKL